MHPRSDLSVCLTYMSEGLFSHIVAYLHFFQSILLFITIKFTPLTYNKTYIYPTGFQVFGVCLALVSMICIPVVFVWKIIKAPGSLLQVRTGMTVLSHLCFASHRRDIGKQCRPRSDAAKRGVCSGSTLFALSTGIFCFQRQFFFTFILLYWSWCCAMWWP